MSFGGSGGGGGTISSASDVVLSNPANGNVLGYNSGTAKWNNNALTASAISDSTATGRSILTAADAAAARVTLGPTGTPSSTTYLRGDGTWVTPTGSALFINVKSAPYSAVGDGVADDTVAIQAAIDDAQDADGGIIFFPAGRYLVTPTANPALQITADGVTLLGEGREVSVLVKSGTGTLISFHGDETGGVFGLTHVIRGGLEKLGLDGNNQTGRLLRAWYCSELSFREVLFNGNPDVCVDAVELWDSRFWDCTWDYNGSSTADTYTPNVWLRNSAAASGFGSSTDSNNQIHFVGCRWESFSNGAVGIEQGTANTANPNGIYFTNCKMESLRVLGGPLLKIGDASVGVNVASLYMHGGAFGAGYSTPVLGISMSGARNTLRDVMISTGSTAIFSTGVESWSSGARLDNVIGNYGGAPTSGVHVSLAGGTDTIASAVTASNWGAGSVTALAGAAVAANQILSAVVSTPATATSTGVPGQIAYDANYVYICTGTNTWRRSAHATW